MLLLMSWKLKEKSDYTSHPETAGRHSARLLLTGLLPVAPVFLLALIPPQVLTHPDTSPHSSPRLTLCMLG